MARDQVDGSVVLEVPFAGRWITQMSPATRVPSHGTDLFGISYGIDFVAVDERRHSAPVRDWRTAFGTEPPERYYAFGLPVTAPVSGRVVAAHDGELDHEGRRAPLPLVSYALTQRSRLRQGLAGLAGNHVMIRLRGRETVVVLVHLKRGSVRVEVGSDVTVGEVIGQCGNSGNSTQPHVHLHVADRADAAAARGMPLLFAGYREWPRHGPALVRELAVPENGVVIEAL